MELARELEVSLRTFAAGGPAELRENGGRVAPLSALSWEVRGRGEKLLLHLWSEHHNLTRRVLAITDRSEERLALAVERFGRSRPDRLEFIRTTHEPSSRELARCEFSELIKRVVASQFPDESLESLTIAADLEHSLSRSYARGVLRRGSTVMAFLAVPKSESADSIAASLTFALLWLDRVRHVNSRGHVAGLRMILPKGSSGNIARICAALEQSYRPQLYELDDALEIVQAMEPQQAANLSSTLVRHRERQALLDRARLELAPLLALSPDALRLHAVPQGRAVVLRFRGLAFARWEDGRLRFATPDCAEEITPASRGKVAAMLRDLEAHRHPLATDTRHPLYRAQAERWLESLVREDVTRIDSTFDSRFVYEQVFANAGGEHGILDVLTCTKTGRLAVLELKASEHIHLPLQAADYWLRLRRHLAQGDFARCGYFSGIDLQNAPPIVYLVAPSLRFHPATGTLIRCLSRDVEMVRIGLAEGWRRGLRVVLRQ